MTPNILWICADQLRHDTLSINGDPIVQTPNLERLSNLGANFSHVYCQNPVCAPSRASFLTGRYPRTVRVRQNGQDIPDYERTVIKSLSDNGYLCGLSGKLHISACHPSVCPVSERRIDDGYHVFNWAHGSTFNYTPDNWLVSEYIDWLRAKGVTHEEIPREDCPYVSKGIAKEYSQTQWCTDKALDFIQRASMKNKPWAFSINYFDPHNDFDPPEDILQKYVDILEDIPLPHFTPGELDNKPVFQRKDHNGSYDTPGHYASKDMTSYHHKLIRAAYYAMIELIDIHIGRLLDYLETTGQLTNTLIIFHSDHGEMLGDHGIYLKGPYFYDAAVRVPLVIAWPGHISGGQHITDIVELVDIAPTIAEACGLPPEPGMQGYSLYKRLTQGTPFPRQSAYCEYYNSNIKHRDPKAYLTMVCDKQFKLVRNHTPEDPVSGELYDMQNDPHETVNQYDNDQYAKIKMRMLELLADRIAFTADPLPIRRANW